MPVIFNKIIRDKDRFLYKGIKFTYNGLLEYLIKEGYSEKYAKEIIEGVI